MKDLFHTDSQAKKIAILRALYLGDMLCCTPALRALRHYYKNAEITLIGLPWAHKFVKRYGRYIDRFIPFPGYQGLPEQVADPGEVDDFIVRMKNERFEILFQMQGDGTVVNKMLQMYEPKLLIGFTPGNPIIQNAQKLIHYPESLPEVLRHLTLLQAAGIPSCGTALEFPLISQDYRAFKSCNLPERYVCIHPGSRSSSRRWHPKYFAAIADYYAVKGLLPVITGTEDEIPISREVLQYMQEPAIDTTGMTNLGTIGLIIKNAQALISNCTGVSHIAAALRTPSFIISMDGEPKRWSPLNKFLHYVYDWKTDPVFTKAFSSCTLFLDNLLSHSHAHSQINTVNLKRVS
jgi:ADP-heptose:LPS heptosyltransferase